MHFYLKLNKNTWIDTGILLIMYLQLVILEFFGLHVLLNKVVTILILLRMFFHPRKQPKGCLFYIGILITMFFLGTIAGENVELNNAKSNFLMQAYTLVYFYYVSFLCSQQPKYMDNIMKKGFWLFNLTMLVNIVVMIIQITRPYKIMAVSVSKSIEYYEDTISGLFQYASVHVVCLFTIFLILYNLSYQKIVNKKLQRNILSGYTAFVALIMIVISLFNDNKAMFLFLPIALLVYLFSSASLDVKKTKIMITLIILLPLFMVFFYNLVEPFRVFVDENIINLISRMSNAISLGNKANGSNERIALISYALKKSSTWILGMGFGTVFLYQSGFEGFNHFGQADLSSILLLGGVWYFALLFFIYYKMMKNMLNLKHTNITLLGVVVIFLLMTLYTQCLTRPNVTMCMLLVVLSFRMQKRYQSGESR